MHRITYLISIIIILIAKSGHAQKDQLRKELRQVASSISGSVGVAIKHLENNDTVSVNGRSHFPMQSVYKFPLALAILDQVDKGKLSLEQKVHMSKDDYFPTWSPLMKKYPDANVDVPLSEILYFTAAQSDNAGCDILFSMLGGPAAADRYIHGLGVKDIAIINTERELHQSWNVQFDNWSTPVAMTQLLEIFHEGNILSKQSHDFLWKAMLEVPMGGKRIKGLLPQGTVVAHRTGTGARNDKGIAGAVNNTGIMVLPDGKHIAITVYVTQASEEDSKLEEVIAKIARRVYDYYEGGELRSKE
ncbi:class A beta-lactamase, subclass A2 [Fulvivirgaceae bacterium PWU4]|uniref:Beta-lactamase n=1 Tax=Chryseosolibacter histidini TaxID=2782349 RepID=A0AAP2DKL3_9BACT|nr:class A beta-lactamase, subclass A2 [Chryseosolibacter histidini]MBT1695594.1 class A beta-lactamase, subclass A2 [Chryseosolibacter histidini]